MFAFPKVFSELQQKLI